MIKQAASDALLCDLLEKKKKYDVKKEILCSFTHEGPEEKNTYSWLSNSEIENVLDAFAKTRDDFVYLGMITYDFDKHMLDDVLEKMDANEGKRYFTLVQNTCYIEDGG